LARARRDCKSSIVKKKKTARRRRPDGAPSLPLRERIQRAAFETFVERGYANVTTLEIARRARASKRELYTLFGSKEAVLSACIAERTNRMRSPLDLPPPQDREQLAATLVSLGSSLLSGACNRVVVSVHRLAIVDPERTREVAQALDTNGRGATRQALGNLFANAQASGLLGPGDPAVMAGQFLGLLWEDLLLRVLLGVTEPPSPDEIVWRSRAATEALLALYSPQDNRAHS
jgi:AcrR family transcriptional regulator